MHFEKAAHLVKVHRSGISLGAGRSRSGGMLRGGSADCARVQKRNGRFVKILMTLRVLSAEFTGY
jgi:hypothetical protein